MAPKTGKKKAKAWLEWRPLKEDNQEGFDKGLGGVKVGDVAQGLARTHADPRWQKQGDNMPLKRSSRPRTHR